MPTTRRSLASDCLAPASFGWHVCLLFWAATSFASPLVAEEWTNLAGTVTIEADFIGIWDGRVILQRPDGSRVSVEKANLQALSRLRVDELVAAQSQQLEQRIAELRVPPKEVVAIPPAKASAAYVPWPQAAKPQELLTHVAGQIRGGHPRVLWDALPPTYQKDVQSLVRTLAENIDAEQYASGMDLTSRLAQTLYEKREFVLGYPPLAALPAETREAITAGFVPLVGVMAEMSDIETLSLENLKTKELEAIIAEKDETMGAYLAQLLIASASQPGLLQAIVEGEGTMEMQGEDRAVLTLPLEPQTPSEGEGTLPPSVAAGQPSGRAPSFSFTKVEQRWLPESLVKSWPQGVARLHAQFQALGAAQSQTAAAGSMLSLALEPLLTQLNQASTQEEFNAVIDPYVNLLQVAGSR